MSKWIKTGDKVIVISGNDKGKTGEVLARSKDSVVVRGVNVRKRHMRKTSQGAGQIITREFPVNISNVNICSAEGNPVRLRARIVEGAKELYYKDGSKEVVHRKI